MEASAALDAMQSESKCYVCHDYLKDAVTVECGHNFCFFCLHQCWKDEANIFRCPVCSHQCQERKFIPNLLLRRMIGITQSIQVSSQEGQQQEVRLCEIHNQELSLFCEEDLEVLCSQCTQSPDHRGHQLKCVEEAASYHRQLCWDYIEYLKSKLAEIQKTEQKQNESVYVMNNKVSVHKKALVSAFEYLGRLVEQEQMAALSRVDVEKRRILETLNTDITALNKHIFTLMALIQDVGTQSMTSKVNVLREARTIYHKYESLQSPTLSSLQLRKEGCSLPPLYATLRTIMKKFKEQVTLNPETAHPDLHVCDDKFAACYMKRKWKIRRKPKKYPFDLEVLGSEEFKKDRHYWETNIAAKTTWAVGVCTSQMSSGERRCWVIRLHSEKYVAAGDDAVPVPLCLEEIPTIIGVYLDCELGQISFYNVTAESHIHSFQVNISQPLTPYFCVGRDTFYLFCL